MPVDIIEMYWTCTSCGHEVLGRHKICSNCGAPRTPDCPERMPDDISSSASVLDQKLLTKFRSGEDWKCWYCDSSQFRTDGTCNRCGSSQLETEIKNSVSASKLPPIPPAQSVYRENSPPVPDRELELDYEIPRPRIWDNSNFLRIFFVFFGTLFFGFLGYFLFSTHEVNARVISVEWTRTVQIERYQIQGHEGWDPSPHSVSRRNLGSRIHHYDRVAVGSHQEPYTDHYSCGQDCSNTPRTCYTTPRSCTSNKNGSATCSGGDQVCSGGDRVCSTRYCTRTLFRDVTDYEDQPRYRDWYSWTVWEWVPNRVLKNSGTSTAVTTPLESISPILGLGEQERSLPPVSSYNVLLSDGEGHVMKYDPVSESQFQRFSPESSHKFRVGALRSTELIQ